MEGLWGFVIIGGPLLLLALRSHGHVVAEGIQLKVIIQLMVIRACASVATFGGWAEFRRASQSETLADVLAPPPPRRWLGKNVLLGRDVVVTLRDVVTVNVVEVHLRSARLVVVPVVQRFVVVVLAVQRE